MEFTEEAVYDLAMTAYNGDASFEVQLRDCALIVIDMQDEFVKPGWTPFWVPGATRMVPKLKGLIERCRENDVPVIYTAFNITYLLLDRPLSGKYMSNRYQDFNNPTWFKHAKIWHEIEPTESDIVIYKPSYGAFYDTPLETTLKNLERNTIIICGTLTNYCCGMTARQGYERGFKVVVIEDLNATDDRMMHEVEIKVLRKGFAKILSSDQLLRLINNSNEMANSHKK